MLGRELWVGAVLCPLTVWQDGALQQSKDSCSLSTGDGELLLSCHSSVTAVHGLASCKGKVCSAIPPGSNWGNIICCIMPLCCLPLRTLLVTKEKDLPQVPEKSSKNTVPFWQPMNSGSEFQFIVVMLAMYCLLPGTALNIAHFGNLN